MKSAFGSRLFRLFLVFSIVPSIAIALLGYYLTTETTSLLVSGTSFDNRHLQLQHQRLSVVLERVVLSLSRDTAIDRGAADFVFVNDTLVADSATLTKPAQLREFCNAYASKDQSGLAEQEGIVIQFASRRIGDNRYLAGFVHPANYIRRLEGSEQVRPGRTGEIRSYYAMFIGLLLLVVLATTAVTAWFFSRRIAGGLARPIADLSEAAGEIANGRFGRQVSVTAEDEIATLVDSFNLMSARLERVTERLAQSERVAAWRTVARRFAHEIKNPLQPILVSLHRIHKLTSDSTLSDQLADPLRAASEEVSHLQELANRFSQLSRLPEPAPTRCNLNDLARSVADLYREQMADRDFRILLAEKEAMVNVDETYFREVVHNLLRNAIDATRPGDTIELTVSIESGTAALTVRDSGRGMDRQTIESARLPYFSTKEDGNGLGLAIVEKIVNEADGTLSIDSKPLAGTRVSILLPLS